MTKISVSFLVLALLGSAGLATAGGLPLGSEQNPPKYLDEAELVVYLMKRADDGYAWRVHTHLYGIGSKSDAVRIEWIAKGKKVSDQRCPLEIDGDQALLRCDLEGKPINASGDVTVNIIFIDDQSEKEYLLRTLNLKIMKFTWMKDHSYQVMHDDNLGVAYAWHQMTGDEFKRGDYELKLYFWLAQVPSFSKAQLRCTVNGTKIPDFETFTSSSYDVEGLYYVKDEERRYHWAPTVTSIYGLYFGTKEEVVKHFTGGSATKWEPGESRIMGDLPGDWDCNLRADGNVVRRFMFKVNDKGRIEPSPAQSAPGFPKLLGTVVWLDMRLPAKNVYDQRVRPDAIKKSMSYGLPWPKHAVFDALRKEVPPASGFADPK